MPYDDFRLKIAAAIPAGQGPDVVQLFYGWLQDYLKAKLLQPLPTELFDTAEIERDFFPLVKQMKVDGRYYAVPTAVRSLSLFWNKKLFAEAGLDPAKPPQTLDELLDMARKLTKRDARRQPPPGRHRARHGAPGSPLAARGADPPDGRPAVLGRRPERRLQHAAGHRAVAWYTDLATKQKVGEFGFLTDGVTAFKAGKAGLMIDGSFRLAAFDAQAGLDYAVAELPTHQGKRSNFASYWVNGITPKATGAKRDAAVKFLKFITTPAAMELWLEKVGELPARKAVAERDPIRNHPKYGAFIRGLGYAEATFFVNETAQRKLFMDMVDRIVLKAQPVPESVAQAAAEEQKLLDAFFK